MVVESASGRAVLTKNTASFSRGEVVRFTDIGRGNILIEEDTNLSPRRSEVVRVTDIEAVEVARQRTFTEFVEEKGVSREQLSPRLQEQLEAERPKEPSGRIESMLVPSGQPPPRFEPEPLQAIFKEPRKEITPELQPFIKPEQRQTQEIAIQQVPQVAEQRKERPIGVISPSPSIAPPETPIGQFEQIQRPREFTFEEIQFRQEPLAGEFGLEVAESIGKGFLVGVATSPVVITQTIESGLTKPIETIVGFPEAIAYTAQSPTRIASFVGESAPLFAPSVIKASPIRFERVRVPTETGEAVLFRGLKFEAKQTAFPLIGEAEGRPVFGKFPEVKETITIEGTLKKGTVFQPETVFQTKFFEKSAEKLITEPSEMLVSKKTIVPETQQKVFREFIELERIVEGQRSAFISEEVLKSGTERLTPQGVQATLEFAQKEGGIPFGSFATRPQLKQELGRSVRDIDIQFERAKPEQLQASAQRLVTELQKRGEKARISPESPFQIETLREGEFVKAIEIKAKGISDGSPEVSARALGFRTDIGRDIEVIGKTEVAGIAGESKRKLAGSLMFSQRGAIGVAHVGRFKDVPDFLRIAKTQLESARIRRTLPETKIRRGEEIISGISTELGIDLSREPLSIDLSLPSRRMVKVRRSSPFPSPRISPRARSPISPISRSPLIRPSPSIIPSSSSFISPRPSSISSLSPIAPSASPFISPSVKSPTSSIGSISQIPSPSPTPSKSPFGSISPSPSVSPFPRGSSIISKVPSNIFGFPPTGRSPFVEPKPSRRKRKERGLFGIPPRRYSTTIIGRFAGIKRPRGATQFTTGEIRGFFEPIRRKSKRRKR